MAIRPLVFVATTVVVVAPANGLTVIVAEYVERFQGVDPLVVLFRTWNWKLKVVAWSQTKLYLALKIRLLGEQPLQVGQ
jgi:hypothetical protein